MGNKQFIRDSYYLLEVAGFFNRTEGAIRNRIRNGRLQVIDGKVYNRMFYLDNIIEVATEDGLLTISDNKDWLKSKELYYISKVTEPLLHFKKSKNALFESEDVENSVELLISMMDKQKFNKLVLFGVSQALSEYVALIELYCRKFNVTMVVLKNE